MFFGKTAEFNKLRFRWKSLNKDLSCINNLEEIAFLEFHETLMKKIVEKGLDNPFEKKKEKEKSKKEIFQTDETKKIYRAIAIKSHPDKKPGGEEVFKELVDSKKHNSINKLFDSAKKVNIKIEEITFDHIEKMEEEINEIEKIIQEKRSSIHWIWYHENNTKRTLIIKNIINNLENDQEKN